MLRPSRAAAPPLLLLVALAACLPGGGAAPATGAPAPLPSRTVLLRTTSLEKVALDSAARAGDLTFGAHRLAPDAEVVTPDGATLIGPEQVAAHLAGRGRGVQVSRVQLHPERLAYCADGLLERDGHYLIAYERGERADTVRGRYAMRWQQQPDGTVRVQELRFGPDGARAPGAGACPSRLTAELRERRVSVWVLPPRVGAVPSTAMGDVAQALQGAGYRSQLVLLGRGIHIGGDGTRREGPTGGGAAGIRVRLRGPIGVEASASLLPSRDRVEAYDGTRGSYLDMTEESRVVTGLLSYEWRRLRLGVGPSVVLAEGRIREERLIRHQSRGGSVSYEGRGVSTDEAWSARRIAPAVDVQFVQPVLSRLSVNVLARYRGGATAAVPDTELLQGLETRSSGLMYGLALGTSF